MNKKRLISLVAWAVTIGLAIVFYFQYQLKDQELVQDRDLKRLTNEALNKINAALVQSRKELKEALGKVEDLDRIVAALEMEKTDFKQKVQALEEERGELQIRIAQLIEEKTTLEKKFSSVQELKKAIRVARIEQRRKQEMERLREYLVKVEMLEALDKVALREGNRGYLVSRGESTFRAKAKINVELEPINRFSYRESQ